MAITKTSATPLEDIHPRWPKINTRGNTPLQTSAHFLVNPDRPASTREPLRRLATPLATRRPGSTKARHHLPAPLFVMTPTVLSPWLALHDQQCTRLPPPPPTSISPRTLSGTLRRLPLLRLERLPRVALYLKDTMTVPCPWLVMPLSEILTRL